MTTATRCRCVFWFCFAVVFSLQSLRAATSDPADASVTRPNKAEVSELIQQLGDDDYHRRRAAEQQLVELGAEVFDRLQLAQQHTDLEVSERAGYILKRIRIQWVRAEDPNDVQQLLQRYETLAVEQREKCVQNLAALPEGRGLTALCRLVRFEASQQLARQAALRVMKSKPAAEYSPAQLEQVRLELAQSERVPVQWLRRWLNHSTAREQANHWMRFVDSEIELIRADLPETSLELGVSLADYYLDQVAAELHAETVFEFLKRRTDLTRLATDDPSRSVETAYLWLWQQDRWDLADLLASHYAEVIEGDRLLTYFQATGLWKNEQDAAADQLALKAFQFDNDSARGRQRVASVIGEMGRHDWAEREWQFAVDKLPVLESADARRWLASLRFHDRGENKEAAQLLEELCDEIEGNKHLKAQIRQSDSIKVFFSQRDFFLACKAQDEGDFNLQRKFLESAYKYEDLDADILIAMYHSPEADESYRKKTLARINKATAKLEQAMRKHPNESHFYNHWAWLISNTEGDFRKAVKYSERSLELSPNSPSYQDTLGRCYYAAGRIKDAIEVQREAVKRHPHLQVMQKQLKLFETELAKSKEPKENS